MLTEQELSTVFINWKELIWCNMRLLKYVQYIIKDRGGYSYFQGRGMHNQWGMAPKCFKLRIAQCAAFISAIIFITFLFPFICFFKGMGGLPRYPIHPSPINRS